MTTDMLIGLILGMWIGMGILKLSELIARAIRNRELKKMMESLLEDLEKLKEASEELQKEEKVKKPRAKKTQK